MTAYYKGMIDVSNPFQTSTKLQKLTRGECMNNTTELWRGFRLKNHL